MKISRRFAYAALGFVIHEAMLIAFVDRPLSEMLRAVDDRQHAFIDFFRAWTDLGKSKWWLWPSALGILICAILARRKSMTQRIRENMRRIGDGLLFLFICIAVSGIVTDIIKPILSRARPVELERGGIYGFYPFDFHARMNSMPSGHATTAFALAFVVAGFSPRWRIPAFLAAGYLALSRVMVNAHYLSDVIAGGVVAFLTVQALRQLKNHNGIFHINKRIFPIDGPPPPR
jgi:undecaprenyl-diphosphatase